ncbi:MAG: hypothetical protein KKF89_06075 [Nanoarchaeota archaeon]|nr:hypothetical protein [Nanoarchaeota archaeon]MBU1855266.1 hypothetical protein [Nanoarchaeota archaeon]
MVEKSFLPYVEDKDSPRQVGDAIVAIRDMALEKLLEISKQNLNSYSVGQLRGSQEMYRPAQNHLEKVEGWFRELLDLQNPSVHYEQARTYLRRINQMMSEAINLKLEDERESVQEKIESGYFTYFPSNNNPTEMAHRKLIQLSEILEREEKRDLKTLDPKELNRMSRNYQILDANIRSIAASLVNKKDNLLPDNDYSLAIQRLKRVRKKVEGEKKTRQEEER